MGVYHFLKRGYGLEAVRLRRLKIARIAALNDPFEFMSLSLRRRGDRQLFEHWRDSLDKDHGLLCFSRRSTNPVQWSHYAENHTGVCLGFDIPDELLMEVKYTARRGAVDIQAVTQAGGPDEERMMFDTLRTKYSHWRYENEWRVFVSLDHDTVTETGLYFHDFGPSLALREIIVGARSTITRAEVKDAIDGLQEVKTYKARLAFQSFQVVENKNRRLWT